jgi:quercetin dioxygenase-like cupin family protein
MTLMSGDANEPVDLSQPRGDGPVWAVETEDLDATLLSWPANEGVAAHVNAERDVLIVVTAGAGMAVVDEREHRLEPGYALIIAKGAQRSIHAGDGGLRYLSVHRRRAPLQIGQAPP